MTASTLLGSSVAASLGNDPWPRSRTIAVEPARIRYEAPAAPSLSVYAGPAPRTSRRIRADVTASCPAPEYTCGSICPRARTAQILTLASEQVPYLPHGSLPDLRRHGSD